MVCYGLAVGIPDREFADGIGHGLWSHAKSILAAISLARCRRCCSGCRACPKVGVLGEHHAAVRQRIAALPGRAKSRDISVRCGLRRSSANSSVIRGGGLRDSPSYRAANPATHGEKGTFAAGHHDGGAPATSIARPESTVRIAEPRHKVPGPRPCIQFPAQPKPGTFSSTIAKTIWPSVRPCRPDALLEDRAVHHCAGTLPGKSQRCHRASRRGRFRKMAADRCFGFAIIMAPGW